MTIAGPERGGLDGEWAGAAGGVVVVVEGTER